MTYKTVFIDWDGTLSNSRFWQRWENDPRKSAHYKILQEVLFAGEQGKTLLIEWMTGLKSYEDVLLFASSATGIPYDELAQELKRSAENMEFINKDTPELIRQLRSKGVNVLIATDNMDTFRFWTVPALGLETMFDGILSSDELGALKSNISSSASSMFFGDYLSSQAISPNETVLLENSLENKVVEQYGIQFLHVNESVSATDHIKNILESLQQ